MTRKQVEDESKRQGYKYYVRGSTGGLFGIFKNRADAEDCKKRHEKMLRESPWGNPGIKVYIDKVKAQERH